MIFFQSEEVQFFAGNTIYFKVSRCWMEVPKEEYESLKLRILNSIAEFSSAKVVLHRLIKAVSEELTYLCDYFDNNLFCCSLVLLFSILLKKNGLQLWKI